MCVRREMNRETGTCRKRINERERENGEREKVCVRERER
jgi:hypothetical protein